MSFTMPDVAATRASMLKAYRDGLRDVLQESVYTVRELRTASEDPEALALGVTGDLEAAAAVDDALLGLRVVLAKDVDVALAAIFGQPVPMPDEVWAEVRTPATVYVHAICPRCGIAQPISMGVHPELLIDDTGSELRLKAKSKGRTHICGQLPLPVTPDGAEGQQELPLDGEPEEAEAGPEPETLMLEAGEHEGHPGPMVGVEAPADGTLSEPITADSPYRTDAHPLYLIVRDGETLESALARIERLDDFNRVIGSVAGQALMDAIRDEGGAFVPFPLPEQTGGAS